MIKVLSKETFKAVCNKCKTHLEYQWPDLKGATSDGETTYWLACPVCFNIIRHKIT